MKLVFNDRGGEVAVAFVECNSTDEADQFLNWYAGRMSHPAMGGKAATEPAVEPAPVESPLVPTGGVPRKLTRADLSQAGMALIQTKGRQMLMPILEKYQAKRISEIPDNRLSEAYNDVVEASK